MWDGTGTTIRDFERNRCHAGFLVKALISCCLYFTQRIPCRFHKASHQDIFIRSKTKNQHFGYILDRDCKRRTVLMLRLMSTLLRIISAAAYKEVILQILLISGASKNGLQQ